MRFLVLGENLHHVAWNVMLALIPVVLAIIPAAGIRAQRRAGKPVSWAVWAPLLVVWLLFLPNSCYLVTEWRHYLGFLSKHPNFIINARHDPETLFLFLSTTIGFAIYTTIGVACFFLSIWPIDHVLKPRPAAKAVFFFVCALGVYLGLIDRLNSWNVVTHPYNVVGRAIYNLTSPNKILLMVAFAAVLWLTYFCIELFKDGLMLRIRSWRAAGRIAPQAG